MAGGALEPVEAEATYQGIPCLSAEFTATPGLGSDDGSVVIAARNPSALRIQIGSVLFTDQPFRQRLTTVARSGDGDRPASTASSVKVSDQGVVESGTLAPFGDLVLRSTMGEVTISRLMPVSIEVVDQDDNGLVLYRIQLGDVRTIWARRGVLYGDYNHYDDAGKPIPGVPQRDLSFTLRTAAAALPGVSETVLAPGAQAAASAAELRDIRWRFADPSRELEHQLAEQDLHAVLDRDGATLRIYQRGEGATEPGALGIPDTHYHAVSAPQVTFTPDAVLVVGSPRQREVEVTLREETDMVGLAAEGDAVILWTDALPSYGLTVAQAGRWILQKPEKQVAMIARTLGAAAPAKALADRLRSWLFRWWRIPDARLRPILPTLDGQGRERPPRVRANVVVEQSESGGATGRSWGNAAGVDLDPEQVQIDADAGILRLGHRPPPGRLLETGIETLEQGALLPPSVRVLFRTERKDGQARKPGALVNADAPYPTAPDDHYLLALERKGSDLHEAEPLALTSAPLVIHAPELVELERLDGSSNRAELNALAAKLAASHFRQPSVVTSYDVRAVGIYPVWPDGAVGQVRWRVSEREATTEAVINSYRRSIDGVAPTYAGKVLVSTVARRETTPASTVREARTSPQPRARR